MAAGDALALVAAYGASRSKALDPEWLREAHGLQVGTLAVILWLHLGLAPIRLPSGLRKAREAWLQLDAEERAGIAADAAGELGIAGPRAPAEVLS